MSGPRGYDAAPRVIDGWHSAGRAEMARDILGLITEMAPGQREPAAVLAAVFRYAAGVLALAGDDRPPAA